MTGQKTPFANASKVLFMSALTALLIPPGLLHAQERPTVEGEDARLTLRVVDIETRSTLLVVDLAKLRPGVIRRSIPPGHDYDVLISNLVPSALYSILVQVEAAVPPAIALPEGMVAAIARKPPDFLADVELPDAAARAAACNKLRISADSLGSATQETEIPKLKSTLESLFRGTVGATCDSEAVKYRADRLIQRTSEIHKVKQVKRGELLKVTVSRVDSGAEWNVIFDTGPRGEWRTTYGFGFIASGFSENEHFVTEENEDGTFTITESENRSVLDLAPAVFFSWMPADKRQQGVVLSPSVGLGFNLENLVVLGGLAFTYNHNVSVSLGLALHQQERLLGRYDENDVVPNSLTEEQLHQDVFTVNPFFSVSLRSLTNPFSGKSNDNGS